MASKDDREVVYVPISPNYFFSRRLLTVMGLFVVGFIMLVILLHVTGYMALVQ